MDLVPPVQGLNAAHLAVPSVSVLIDCEGAFKYLINHMPLQE